MTVSEMLSHVSLLQDLAPEEREWIAERCRRRDCSVGDRIYFAGDLGHQVYFVGSGTVKIHLAGTDGDDYFYCDVRPGEFFGEVSVLDGEPRTAGATCTQDAELAYLSREGFIECLARFPAMNLRLLRVLCRRLRNVDPQMEMITSLNVYGRVAKQLLDMARLHGVSTEMGEEIRLGLGCEEIALMVGASPESARWVLRQYESHGYLEMDGNKIVILRPDELKKRCQSV